MTKAEEEKKRAEAIASLEYIKRTGKIRATDEQIRMRPTWMLQAMCWDTKRGRFKPGMENTRAGREFKRRIETMQTDEARNLLARCALIEKR